MPYSDKEKQDALQDQNNAISEYNHEHSGVWDRFRGRVPLKARIYIFREKD